TSRSGTSPLPPTALARAPSQPSFCPRPRIPNHRARLRLLQPAPIQRRARRCLRARAIRYQLLLTDPSDRLSLPNGGNLGVRRMITSHKWWRNLLRPVRTSRVPPCRSYQKTLATPSIRSRLLINTLRSLGWKGFRRRKGKAVGLPSRCRSE